MVRVEARIIHIIIVYSMNGLNIPKGMVVMGEINAFKTRGRGQAFIIKAKMMISCMTQSAHTDIAVRGTYR